ncbi:hypothetical protein F511_10813 [Dorcoceras hygrometricum]|uniref:Uncharacterized protein n=1 Tax=Dorcoceras hygrometricum TaxID=472368 RepID=A0A2Z7BBV3_9LAMI|nr:hypothetical protein F511_10813 [Dorcoceras hygrometricum]
MFLVALDSLRLALSIDTGLESRSDELRNPSNAIVGAVTTGYECLPPSCDGLTGPDDHGPMISRLIDRALTLLFTTTDCDDITTDVIIADSRFLLALCLDPIADSSSCLLIMMTSLLMSSLLIQRLILLTLSSLIQLLRFLSSADLYALALLLVFIHLLIMMSSPMTSSSMVHLDVPAGSSSSSSACSWFLSFQLIHFAPAGSTWHPPDYEQLTQLWTSPLLIQLPYTMMN